MESQKKRTWAEVSMEKLAHNYHALRQLTPYGTKFMGLVKADAYGHGAVPVAKKLEELGADYLGVACLDEAIELREAGIQAPILILGCTPSFYGKELMQYNITQACYDLSYAKALSAEAQSAGGTITVHIQCDTGMTRLGFLCDEAHMTQSAQEITEAVRLPGLHAEGIFTHFSDSDGSEEYTMMQFNRFLDIIQKVKELGYEFAIRHCANTGAVARYPETYLDMVRPGLLLYGYGEFAEELNLKPVMSLKAAVSTIKTYPAGTAISYGGIYVTPHKTRIGVIPYGYADGFFRCLSNKCSIMTAEGPAPQRGKICMDMCMIDLTDKMGVDVGSEVEIFGKQNSINDLADLAGTIPYELTCAVSKRVPRIYYRDGKVIEKELLLRG